MAFLGFELDSLVESVQHRQDREISSLGLCFRLGEASVSYWHSQDEGFGSRRSLDDLPTPTRLV